MNENSKTLLSELNSLMLYFKSDTLLSKLPSGSWLASATLNENTLSIEVLRNDALLVEKNWYQVADPTQWLYLFIPVISKFLAIRQSIIPANMKVLVSVKSEIEEWRSNCSAFDLIKAAENGEINEFGSMMTLINPEVIKNE